MDYLLLVMVALHAVAMVVVLGYYATLGRVVVPAVRQSLDVPTAARTVMAIESRALPLVLAAVAAFAASGAYLMLVDARYTGLGDFFSSTWTLLITIKHGVVLAFVVLGVLLDRLVRDLGSARAPEAEDRLRRIGRGADAASVLGLVTLVLTAAAQVAP